MNQTITSFAIVGPNKGHYDIIDQEDDDYIRTTRTSSNGKTVDDQVFDLKSNEKGCMVTGSSWSEALIQSDNGRNFCDLWNIFRYSDTFTFNYATDCNDIPTDPDYDCVAYHG
jgi:hypothetical protein